MLDAFAFSSALVACAALALTAASALALGLAAEPAVLALAFCGTLVVYCVDRVRDLARDAQTSPLRSAFVARHRRALLALAGAAVCAALAAGAAAGTPVVAVAAAVAACGFAHRRLKRFAWAKPIYLTSAWTAVAVGMPAAAALGARTPETASVLAAALARVALIVGATVQANVVLSNLRDAEGIAGRVGERWARALAAGFVALALAAALLGPPAQRGLAALPAATALAIAAFRPGERYGALAVDGALLLGATLAWALTR
jgi:hypothetical protein